MLLGGPQPPQPGPREQSRAHDPAGGLVEGHSSSSYLPDEHSAHVPVVPAEGCEHLCVSRVCPTAIAGARA